MDKNAILRLLFRSCRRKINGYYCVSVLEQTYDQESSDPDAQKHNNYFCVVLGCNAICHIL